MESFNLRIGQIFYRPAGRFPIYRLKLDHKCNISNAVPVLVSVFDFNGKIYETGLIRFNQTWSVTNRFGIGKRIN